MDAVKRAASRLRRMQGVLAGNSTPSIYGQPFRTREHTTQAKAARLRSIIDDTVVAFVPPSLPAVGDAGIVVTNALAQLSPVGGWALWMEQCLKPVDLPGMGVPSR